MSSSWRPEDGMPGNKRKASVGPSEARKKQQRTTVPSLANPGDIMHDNSRDLGKKIQRYCSHIHEIKRDIQDLAHAKSAGTLKYGHKRLAELQRQLCQSLTKLRDLEAQNEAAKKAARKAHHGTSPGNEPRQPTRSEYRDSSASRLVRLPYRLVDDYKDVADECTHEIVQLESTVSHLRKELEKARQTIATQDERIKVLEAANKKQSTGDQDWEHKLRKETKRLETIIEGQETIIKLAHQTFTDKARRCRYLETENTSLQNLVSTMTEKVKVLQTNIRDDYSAAACGNGDMDEDVEGPTRKILSMVHGLQHDISVGATENKKLRAALNASQLALSDRERDLQAEHLASEALVNDLKCTQMRLAALENDLAVWKTIAEERDAAIQKLYTHMSHQNDGTCSSRNMYKAA